MVQFITNIRRRGNIKGVLFQMSNIRLVRKIFEMRKLKVAVINSSFDECDRKILFEIILSEFVYSELFDVSHINEILESEYKTNV